MTFEIFCNNRWVKVSWWIFRSWSGQRSVNGYSFHGRVFNLGTTTVVRKSQHSPFREFPMLEYKGSVNA